MQLRRTQNIKRSEDLQNVNEHLQSKNQESFNKYDLSQATFKSRNNKLACGQHHPPDKQNQKSVPKGMETMNWKEREPSFLHRLSMPLTSTLSISIFSVKISLINIY